MGFQQSVAKCKLGVGGNSVSTKRLSRCLLGKVESGVVELISAVGQTSVLWCLNMRGDFTLDGLVWFSFSPLIQLAPEF